MEGETLSNRLRDLEAYAQVVALGYALAVVEAETFPDTLGDVEAEVLVHTLAGTLDKVQSKKLARHWAMWRRRHSLSTTRKTSY